MSEGWCAKEKKYAEDVRGCKVYGGCMGCNDFEVRPARVQIECDQPCDNCSIRKGFWNSPSQCPKHPSNILNLTVSSKNGVTK